MGWAAGSGIVGPVANVLVRGVDAQLVEPDFAQIILEKLIDECQTNDWDTEYEVLWDYETVPWVVAAFAKCGVTQD